MKAWKKGAVVGGFIGLIVVLSLGIFNSGMAFVVILFFPDFIILGAIMGYLFGRYTAEEGKS